VTKERTLIDRRITTGAEAVKKKRSLPPVQLVPTARDSGAFQCASAYPDSESDVLYLVFYCRGMDVTVSLDLEQLEHVVRVAGELAAEQRELQD